MYRFFCLFVYTASFMYNYSCKDNKLSYMRGIEFQSAPPWEAAGVFKPRDGSLRTQGLHL